MQYYISQTSGQLALNGQPYAVGNDTTNNGQSPGAPFLTVDKFNSIAANGDKVEINDGDYRADTIFGQPGYHSCVKWCEYVASRPSTVRWLAKAGVTSRVANNGTSTVGQILFRGIIFDGENLVTRCTDTGGSASVWIYDQCQFNNGVQDGSRSNTPTGTFIYLNCQVNGATSLYGLRHDNMAAGSFVYIDGLSGRLTNITSNAGAVYCQATAAGASVYMNNMGVWQTNASSSSANVVSIYGVSNVILLGTGMADGPTCLLDGAAAGAPAVLRIGGSSVVTVRNPSLRGFRVQSNVSATGYMILIGSDGDGGTANNTLINPILKDCWIVGSTAGSTEGINIGHQAGGFVTGCYVRNCTVSTVPKSGTSSTIFFDNDLGDGKGGSAHMYSKGSDNTSFILNKIHMRAGFLNKAMLAAYDSGGNAGAGKPDLNTLFMGNTIYCDDATPVPNLVLVGTAGTPTPADLTTGTIFAMNNYQLLGGVSGNPWNITKAGVNTLYPTVEAFAAGTLLAAGGNEPTYQKRVVTTYDKTFWADSYRKYAKKKIMESDPWLPDTIGL